MVDGGAAAASAVVVVSVVSVLLDMCVMESNPTALTKLHCQEMVVVVGEWVFEDLWVNWGAVVTISAVFVVGVVDPAQVKMKAGTHVARYLERCW